MKFFEIIFILLLMLPVALLMRYFITKLSSQRPRQRRSVSGDEFEKPTISGWLKKRRQRKELERAEEEEWNEPEPQPAPPVYDPDFSPRTPTSMKRTERIPFSEMYGQFDRQLSQQNRTGQRKTAGQSGTGGSAGAGGNKAARSEKSPTKRQKRHNRERARKRERSRRDRQEQNR